MDIPDMFIESWWIDEEENTGGGTLYVKLTESEDTVLLGEFGLTEEGSHITKSEGDEWVFTAAQDDRVNSPPFRRVYEADKTELQEELETERFFYGAKLCEAWDNWSEGDIISVEIDGDDRAINHTYERLTDYERGY